MGRSMLPSMLPGVEAGSPNITKMSKRPLSEAKLEYFAEHIWDIDENDTGNTVDNDSDLSKENVDSFSEQQLTDDKPVEDSPH
ncbi:hypothetical protein RN001_012397 [Aquatica leii]|uniref:Uncharacterized protein n=1 Tax=Aquatica leii TaxID=1421715 RepID=A0AAN7Q1K1_9COLE|nr:hypothetical protein RN001_012397 [Aquatica leii]